MNGLVGSDAATVRSFVTLNLEPGDLTGGRMSAARQRGIAVAGRNDPSVALRK